MNEKELFKKYPKIFPLMENGYYRISSFIPEGWMEIVDNLCECIQGYIDNNNIHNPHLPKLQQVEVVQIKEKFAELRFYTNGNNNTIDGMIEFAELLSTKTCMYCGKPGEQREVNRWLDVICKSCIRKEKLRKFISKIKYTTLRKTRKIRKICQDINVKIKNVFHIQ